jgi:YfiH family protein
LRVPDDLVIGFSTRSGGVSAHPFSSLNMSTSRGDDPQSVAANRKRFLDDLEIAESDLAIPAQVSGGTVQRVDAPGVYPATDALFSSNRGTILSVLTADCSPVLFWSEEKPMWGAVHSGWQGSELNILGQTLSQALVEFEIPAASIYMVIGPGLSEQNFEVGPEFESKFSDKYLRIKAGTGKFYFDNNGFLRDTAMEIGVPAAQIEILPFCSYDDEALFYSHRRDQGQTGRMISVIGMIK